MSQWHNEIVKTCACEGTVFMKSAPIKWNKNVLFSSPEELSLLPLPLQLQQHLRVLLYSVVFTLLTWGHYLTPLVDDIMLAKLTAFPWASCEVLINKFSMLTSYSHMVNILNILLTSTSMLELTYSLLLDTFSPRTAAYQPFKSIQH